jgi:hypothetical protein
VAALSVDPTEEPDPNAAGAEALGDLLARECAAIVAMSSTLSAAALEVLAHRLPILWASSTAPLAWQIAELWRMQMEKPIAVWQAWTSLGAWPLAAVGLLARSAAGQTPPHALALVAATDGAATLRVALDELHELVAANARRLDRQSRSRR